MLHIASLSFCPFTTPRFKKKKRRFIRKQVDKGDVLISMLAYTWNVGRWADILAMAKLMKDGSSVFILP